jgi:hypothetical protein
MTTREEIRIRRLILEEYRAGTSIKQAVINIRAKLRSNDVSKSTIDDWYTRFRSGQIMLFDHDTNQDGISTVSYTLPNEVKVIILRMYKYKLFRMIFTSRS